MTSTEEVCARRHKPIWSTVIILAMLLVGLVGYSVVAMPGIVPRDEMEDVKECMMEVRERLAGIEARLVSIDDKIVSIDDKIEKLGDK